MRRTQVQLEEAQYEQIRRMAAREGVSISAAIRRLLDRGMAAGEAKGPAGAKALLALAGIAEGPSDLGRRHDHYLSEER